MGVERALVSTWDKSGLEGLASSFRERGVEVISTGGTARVLREMGCKVVEVESISGFPSLFGGRVKTLHPAVMGAILMRRDSKEDLAEADAHGIKPVDLVVVDLYPFEAASASGSPLDELVEKIDIGGIALVRAAAKNFDSVAVVVDKADYPMVSQLIRERGEIPAEVRRSLAVKAFRRSSTYDALISFELARRFKEELNPCSTALIPMPLSLKSPLRYGENPHQRASLFSSPMNPPFEAEKLHGKELSYNNMLDLESALVGCHLLAKRCACVVIKHNQPCGIAVGSTPREAYARAVEADPVSAFGGVVGFTRPVDGETAEEIGRSFKEAIVAPDYSTEALSILSKRERLSLLRANPESLRPRLSIRNSVFGILVQEEREIPMPDPTSMRWASGGPAGLEEESAEVAWAASYLLKSNAVAIAKGGRTVGLCGGQTNRVSAVAIALQRAGELARGSVMVSDGFFPFPDSVELAAESGVSFVIQPGGSVKDEEVIEAARARGIAMALTGIRLFRH